MAHKKGMEIINDYNLLQINELNNGIITSYQV
jgi:hypothetical protein